MAAHPALHIPSRRLGDHSPQVPPVLQDEALLEVEPNEKELPPETLEAKVDTFFFTEPDWHAGQVTWLTPLKRTNSSKAMPQSLHTNSKIGIESHSLMIN